ncbi:hypothetical protein ACFQVC_07095 [Streptomyces monticola]|uniref:Uncharacterized protein n=1 Tax=Streptomyces monticola TaxID=2666263 RepID=A0ABW2JEW9_9ACTN
MAEAVYVAQLAREFQEQQEAEARWKRHADSFAAEAATADRERDAAYRERAHLLAWLAALHPDSAVMTPATDVDAEGWHVLFLVAGGWQMSWHIAPHDLPLFRHVEIVDVADPRVQWDGHSTRQKYSRVRRHTRLLAIEAEVADASTAEAPR